MKKFTGKLAVFLLLLALLVIPFNVYTDPYNIFHADALRDNGVEPNKNYIKTRFVLKHRDAYDSYLLGSSRAGFIDVSRISEGNWYNLSYSEGLPKEQYETLRSLIGEGEIPKRVYLSIDNISFLVDPASHEGELYRKAYPYKGSPADKLRFYASYLDTITTLEALPIIRSHQGDDAALQNRMYTMGCEELNLNLTFDEGNTGAYWADYYEPRIDEAVEEIGQIAALCKEHGIALTVFTNPLYITTYEKSVEKGYLDFLEKLSEVTPFYNFSGYNEISMNSDCYFETSHFKPAVGEKMLEIMEKGGDEHAMYAQGFGYYVTKENSAEFMEIIRHQVYVTGVLEYKGK